MAKIKDKTERAAEVAANVASLTIAALLVSPLVMKLF